MNIFSTTPRVANTGSSEWMQSLGKLRFACPYQKYDPFNSPCLPKSTQNPEGGVASLIKLKYAIASIPCSSFLNFLAESISFVIMIVRYVARIAGNRKSLSI